MKNLSLCLLLFSVFSCTNTGKHKDDATRNHLSKIDQMDWVIGTWENRSDKGDLQETWTKTDDSTYHGKTFMIVNRDTVFSETISLEERGGELHYIPITRDQNSSFPVRFKYISTENGEIIFENKEHDFPQRVIYKNAGSDSLYARIEGNENGQFRKEEFAMTKGK